MKAAYLIYHDILEDRVDNLFKEHGIDYYTEWEEVKGKGKKTDAHLGTRTFPGFNNVRLIAFDDDEMLAKLIKGIEELNKDSVRLDDKVRLFQIPLERIV